MNKPQWKTKVKIRELKNLFAPNEQNPLPSSVIVNSTRRVRTLKSKSELHVSRRGRKIWIFNLNVIRL